MSASSVLRALSSLAPAPTQNAAVDSADLVWLGMTGRMVPLAANPATPLLWASAAGNDRSSGLRVVGVGGSLLPESTKLLESFAARASLNGAATVPVAYMVAVGWTANADGGLTRFTHPIVQARAKLARVSNGDLLTMAMRPWELERAGQWSLDAPIKNEAQREDLADRLPWVDPVGAVVLDDALLVRYSKLHAWLRELTSAAGWRLVGVTGRHPNSIAANERGTGAVPGDVTVCIGYALLPVADRSPSGLGFALAAWAGRTGIDSTAFAALVQPSDGVVAGGNDLATTEPVRSHVPLTSAQERVVRAARTGRVTVVSGSPGTGKTHSIVAMCGDAVNRGESVLIATRSVEAAEVIAEQLARQPGPVPLRFGSPDAIEAAFAEIERRLASDEVDVRDHQRTHARYLSVSEAVTTRLEALSEIQRAQMSPAALMMARERVPGCFELEADLDGIAEQLDRSTAANGWFGTAFGRDARRRRASKQVSALAGAPCDTAEERAVIEDALSIARGLRRSTSTDELASELGELWPELERTDSDELLVTGRQLDRLTLERLSRPAARSALASIATALRSGQAGRQRLLSSIPGDAFRAAAPIWLGTLGDIERLLPTDAAFFDLVVIDEASQVDLSLAAPALLRGSRCVVLGDPRQLRHVSFVSDARIQEVFESGGLSADLARLDVRRNSVFDVASGVSPVLWLDEHQRSLPHLAQFSISEFYDRAVTVATRYPTTECRDCIDVVEPGSDTVAAVIARIRQAVRENPKVEIGVVTPFRDLVEALQDAVLEAFGAQPVIDMRLMVTTVHGFQGAERNHIIVVPGIDADSPPGRRRFVEDRNLFNVMVSRARKHMDVVTAEPPDEATLLGRFIAWSAQPPPPTPVGEPPSEAAAVFGGALADAGLEVYYSYPVGTHRVDVVARNATLVRGVMCGVHPSGVEAHIDRHTTLRRAGWHLLDLIPGDDNAAIAERAIALASELRGDMSRSGLS